MGWWGAQEKEREGVSYNDFIAPDSEYYDDWSTGLEFSTQQH